MESLCERWLRYTHDAVYSATVGEGRIFNTNKALVSLLELDIPAEDVIGQPLDTLLVPVSPPDLGREQLLRTGELRDFECHFKTLKGHDRWILRDAFLADTGAGPDAVAEFIDKDITDRKTAELAMDAERERLNVTLHSIGDAVIATDEHGAVFLMNPVAKQMTGYRQSEALGRPISDIFHLIDETTRRPCEDPVSRVLRTGSSVGLYQHAALIARDGREHIIAASGAPIRAAEGSLSGVVLVFRDITATHHRQQALQQSEAQYRALFQSMYSGFALHEILLDDRGQPKDYRFIDVNNRFENMVGLKAAEIVGRTALEVFPDLEPFWIETYGKVALTGKSISFERYAAVQRKIFEVTAYAPGPNQFATIFRDVTQQRRAAEERRRLEEQMRQAQKLESLGVLAGGIAHDFNNLLTSILGNTGLAMLDLSGSTPLRQRLAAVETAARRAAELCRQMLAYSGHGQFVVAPVNLSGLVKEMGRLLHVSMEKKATVQHNLAEDLPLIEADASQMRQVIMNLMINASEALGGQAGTIRVTTGARECSAADFDAFFDDPGSAAGPYVYFEIADTGCGMDGETRGKIFDPFFSTKFTGRGLGLAAVLGIVRYHKGGIKVSSAVGQGTTFSVYFPVPKTPLAEEPEAAKAREDRRLGGTVLIIDDEETVRAITRQMLERSGCRVLTATDGQEGIEIYRRQGATIDVILLDMSMPRMGGDEVFLEIRRMNPQARVILTSGHAEAKAAARFTSQGQAGFIQKPYTYNALYTAIRDRLIKA